MRPAGYFIPPASMKTEKTTVETKKRESEPIISAFTLQKIGIGLLFLLFVWAFSSCKKEDTAKEEFVFGTCKPVALSGALLYDASKKEYTYNTKGGGKVVITNTQFVKFTHSDYAKFELSWWGETTVGGQTKLSAQRENLNGQHLKDRESGTRTFIFPDGAKITITSKGESRQVETISIYENETLHRINYNCNTVEYSASNATFTQKIDQQEPDGETSTIEISNTGLLYLNIYNEPSVGNRTLKRVLLGELQRASPNLVNDFYDDPRLAHT